MTEFNGQGFPVTVTQAVGQVKSYDNQGFLITSAPPAPVHSPTGVALGADSTASPSGSGINVIKVISGATSIIGEVDILLLGAACAMAGAFIL